jgi:hypothetical protein
LKCQPSELFFSFLFHAYGFPESQSCNFFFYINETHPILCGSFKKRDMKKNKSRRLQSIIKMPTMLIKININAALSKNSGMVWRLLLSLGMCKKVLCCGSYFLQRSPPRVAPRSGDSGATAVVPPSPCPRNRGAAEKNRAPSRDGGGRAIPLGLARGAPRRRVGCGGLGGSGR